MADLSALAALPVIGLTEVLATAAATTRVDRKYLVPAARAARFLAELPPALRLLSIDDRVSTHYRSTYFDTDDLLTCRAHVQGRRRRWKARSRLYVEDGLCRLELKVRDGAGVTRKFFMPTGAAAYGHMNAEAVAFFTETLLQEGHVPTTEPGLAPVVEVAYERATLADPTTGTRVTLDFDVRATRRDRVMEVDTGHVIVETKGGRMPGVPDRLLGQLGARPVSFSKYVAAASLMDPRIPDNDVRRLLGRQLHLLHPPRTAHAPLETSDPAPPHDNLRRTA